MEECPKCERDNAYFDGYEYICPDCDYTWGDAEDLFYDDDDDDDEYDSDEDYWNTVCYKEGLNRYCCHICLYADHSKADFRDIHNSDGHRCEPIHIKDREEYGLDISDYEY